MMKAKTRHPRVVLTMLLPYHPSERKIKLPDGFDRSWYPPEMETAACGDCPCEPVCGGSCRIFDRICPASGKQCTGVSGICEEAQNGICDANLIHL